MSKKEQLVYMNFTFPNDPTTQGKIEMIKSLERMRMLLYKDFQNYLQFISTSGIDDEILKEAEKVVEPIWKADFNGKRIKIYIPDVLPSIYIKTTNEASGYFVEQWKKNIAKAIKNIDNFNFKFDEIFVWIKLFNPVKFDGDNKFFKPIIDGICRSGIIKDDHCNIVKFGVDAQVSNQNWHTEVYIFGDNEIPKFIKQDIK
ncbi:hypothetical protein [Clostridium cochlearium]|uniref:hypothetical protein n=1 Tax=Clostridium cochlearium TaxID=1494 RepID=UPI0017D0287A|nr:hypothetical protein [Clostridium cochlearium]NMA58164.1 hypothetical protein [Clostridium cochlearium]